MITKDRVFNARIKKSLDESVEDAINFLFKLSCRSSALDECMPYNKKLRKYYVGLLEYTYMVVEKTLMTPPVNEEDLKYLSKRKSDVNQLGGHLK